MTISFCFIICPLLHTNSKWGPTTDQMSRNQDNIVLKEKRYHWSNVRLQRLIHEYKILCNVSISLVQLAYYGSCQSLCVSLAQLSSIILSMKCIVQKSRGWLKYMLQGLLYSINMFFLCKTCKCLAEEQFHIT